MDASIENPALRSTGFGDIELAVGAWEAVIGSLNGVG